MIVYVKYALRSHKMISKSTSLYVVPFKPLFLWQAVWGFTVAFLLLHWFLQDASQQANFPSSSQCWGGAVQCLGITATNRKHFMLSIHSYLRRERTWGPGQELLCNRERKLTWLLVTPVHCVPCGKWASIKSREYSAGIDCLLNDRMNKLHGFTKSKILINKRMQYQCMWMDTASF